MADKNKTPDKVPYHILLDAAMKEKWEKNLPSGFSSLADFMRSVADMYFEGELAHDSAGGMDRDQVEEVKQILQQFENKIIEQLKLLRIEITSAETAAKQRKQSTAQLFKQSGIEQLKKLWLKDPEIIQYTTMDQLISHIPYEYEFLREYAYDAFVKLEEEGYLTLVSKSDKNLLVWNEDRL